MAKARGMELREPDEDMLLAEHLIARQREVDEARASQESSNA